MFLDEGYAAGQAAAGLLCFQHLVEDHQCGRGAEGVCEVQGLVAWVRGRVPTS